MRKSLERLDVLKTASCRAASASLPRTAMRPRLTITKESVHMGRPHYSHSSRYRDCTLAPNRLRALGRSNQYLVSVAPDSGYEHLFVEGILTFKTVEKTPLSAL